MEKVYSRQFFEELRELHDLAMEESYCRGLRHNLGVLSVGASLALWRATEGGESWLKEQGMRLGEHFTPVMRRLAPPSTLFIFGDEVYQGDIRLATEFSLYLNPKNGFIDVYRSVVGGSRPVRDRAKSLLHQVKERKVGLATPTEEDLQLLKDELERGASGAFALRSLL